MLQTNPFVFLYIRLSKAQNGRETNPAKLVVLDPPYRELKLKEDRQNDLHVVTHLSNFAP